MLVHARRDGDDAGRTCVERDAVLDTTRPANASRGRVDHLNANDPDLARVCSGAYAPEPADKQEAA